MAHAFCRRPLIAETRLRSRPVQVTGGGQRGIGKSSSPSTSVSPVSIIPPLLHTHSFIYHPRCIMFFSQYFSFPCQYHSTIAPYSFIHLPPTLYNVFLPVLQFSAVNIIPPLLRTHSFIFHPHFVMFFSQYFSFPLSVSFHYCSILIHSSTTHAV